MPPPVPSVSPEPPADLDLVGGLELVSRRVKHLSIRDHATRVSFPASDFTASTALSTGQSAMYTPPLSPRSLRSTPSPLTSGRAAIRTLPPSLAPSLLFPTKEQPFASTSTQTSQWYDDGGGRLFEFRSKPSPSKSTAKARRTVISKEELPVSFETATPNREQLLEAASIHVLGPMGKPVPFGDLFHDKKTIVCFIRHFLCPQCQDYMLSIAEHADPELLAAANVNLVIVSNGSPAMIAPYLRISKAPFQLFTDPTLKLYDALGMNLRTKYFGSKLERGEYIQHGFAVGILNGIKRGLQAGLPIWESPGDLDQVGGEFIMGPGLKCSYAHRMTSTTSHDSIRALMRRANVPVPPLLDPEVDTKFKTSWLQRHSSAIKIANKAIVESGDLPRDSIVCADSDRCSVVDRSRTTSTTPYESKHVRHRHQPMHGGG